MEKDVSQDEGKWRTRMEKDVLLDEERWRTSLWGKAYCGTWVDGEPDWVKVLKCCLPVMVKTPTNNPIFLPASMTSSLSDSKPDDLDLREAQTPTSRMSR